MTYPPQPGQQPGWNGYGGQPPQGGCPQGYQQHGGHPHQGGYPPPGQVPPYGYPQGGGGWGGPPPPKSRAGLWAGLGAGALAVVAFVITAFVAPGFLLGDDSGDPPGGAGAQAGGQGGGNSAEAFAQGIVAAFNNSDTNTLNAAMCPGAEPDVSEVIGQASVVENMKLGAVKSVSDTEATAEVSLTAAGSPMTAVAALKNEGGNWCWDGITMGSAGSSPSVGASESSSAPAPGTGGGDPDGVVSRFVEAVNNGDKNAAMSLVCPDQEYTVGTDVERAIGDSAKLTAGPAEQDGSVYTAEVTGTDDDGRVEGAVGVSDDGCVIGLVLF
ncbi:hypothetical protein [Prauserella muralis]|nr:hypothetical protein [Prauserella muralis]TWE30049.1 hypothetical protein FHX69_2745 [Prauserella muralis]